MRDDLIADALRAHVTAEEPPLGLTAPDLVAAGRRSHLVRVGAAASGTALITTTALLLLTHVLASGPPARPATGALDPAPYCATASRPADGPWFGPSAAPDPKYGGAIFLPIEPPERAAARFTCHLMSAVAARLPGARFDPTGDDGPGPLEVVRVGDPLAPFSGAAVVTDATGSGTIGFSIRPVSDAEVAAILAQCREDTSCEVREGAAGEQIIVNVGQPDANGVIAIGVNIFRAREALAAGATNVDDRAVRANGTKVRARPQPPLDAEALIAILSSPALTLFPAG